MSNSTLVSIEHLTCFTFKINLECINIAHSKGALTLGLAAPYRAKARLFLLSCPLPACAHIALAIAGPEHGYVITS